VAARSLRIVPDRQAARNRALSLLRSAGIAATTSVRDEEILNLLQNLLQLFGNWNRLILEREGPQEVVHEPDDEAYERMMKKVGDMVSQYQTSLSFFAQGAPALECEIPKPLTEAELRAVAAGTAASDA
jgi:hypothetical protein